MSSGIGQTKPRYKVSIVPMGSKGINPNELRCFSIKSCVYCPGSACASMVTPYCEFDDKVQINKERIPANCPLEMGDEEE